MGHQDEPVKLDEILKFSTSVSKGVLLNISNDRLFDEGYRIKVRGFK